MPRRVLITGGSSGIGRALVDAFCAVGDLVWTTSRDAGDLPPVAAIASGSDLAKSEAVADLAADVRRRWGALDLVVNNAGVAAFGPIEELETRALEEMIAVNLTAPILLCRELVAPLSRARGQVINVTSSSAVRTVAGRPASAYAAAKGGLESLTRALAIELAPRGIRVNAVAPGTVRTRMTEAQLAGEGASLAASRFPLGRVGEPDDVVAAVRYLASPAAAWVTGHVLRVDGGFTVA